MPLLSSNTTAFCLRGPPSCSKTAGRARPGGRPTAFDDDTRTLHLRRVSPACRTQLDLDQRQIVGKVNQVVGDDTVRRLKILAPGHVDTPPDSRPRTTLPVPERHPSSRPAPAHEPRVRGRAAHRPAVLRQVEPADECRAGFVSGGPQNAAKSSGWSKGAPWIDA